MFFLQPSNHGLPLVYIYTDAADAAAKKILLERHSKELDPSTLTGKKVKDQLAKKVDKIYKAWKEEDYQLGRNDLTDLSLQTAMVNNDAYEEAVDMWVEGSFTDCKEILDDPAKHGIAGFVFAGVSPDTRTFHATFHTLYFTQGHRIAVGDKNMQIREHDILVGFTNPHAEQRGLAIVDMDKMQEVVIMPVSNDEDDFPKVFSSANNQITDNVPAEVRQALFRDYLSERDADKHKMAYVPVAMPIPFGLNTVEFPFILRDPGNTVETSKNRWTQDNFDRGQRTCRRLFLTLARKNNSKAYPGYTSEDDFPHNVTPTSLSRNNKIEPTAETKRYLDAKWYHLPENIPDILDRWVGIWQGFSDHIFTKADIDSEPANRPLRQHRSINFKSLSFTGRTELPCSSYAFLRMVLEKTHPKGLTEISRNDRTVTKTDPVLVVEPPQKYEENWASKSKWRHIRQKVITNAARLALDPADFYPPTDKLTSQKKSGNVSIAQQSLAPGNVTNTASNNTAQPQPPVPNTQTGQKPHVTPIATPATTGQTQGNDGMVSTTVPPPKVTDTNHTGTTQGPEDAPPQQNTKGDKE